MNANDVNLARELFADLVVAWRSKHAQPPNRRESDSLVQFALKMAHCFDTARKRAVSPQPPPATNADASPICERQTTNHVISLTQLIRDWGTRIAARCSGHNGRDLVSRLERYVVPHIGNRPAADLTQAEILSVLRGIVAQGHAPLAYQIFRDLSAMYRYAKIAGVLSNDPTLTLGTYVRKPKPRHGLGIFHPDALGEFLVATRAYRGKTRSTASYMFRLAPMLFLRPVELRELEWREVDLDAAMLAISPARMKSQRPHIVPLPRQAVRILRDVENMTGGMRFVFNGGRGRDQPPAFGAFFQMIRRIGYANTVTPHGFRAMASTWLNEQGWRADAIEKQLSHLSGAGHPTRRIYNRAEYLSERRKMMQEWADYLESLETKARRSLKNIGPLSAQLQQ